MKHTRVAFVVVSALLVSVSAFADKRLDDAVAKANDLIQKMRPDEAVKAVQKVCGGAPSVECQLALADVQRRTGNASDALASVAKAAEIATSPADKARALAAQVDVDLNNGKSKDALAHGQAAAATGDAAGLAALARAQVRAQDAAGAMATADKAVAAGATVPAAHVARGEALILSRHAPEAEAAFRKALELDPKNVPAQVGVARALIDQGKSAEAVTMAKAASEADPNNPMAHAMLGAAILLGAGNDQAKWGEAIGAAQQGNFLAKDNPDVQMVLGRIFEGGANYQQATVAYQAALAADPDYSPARAALIDLQIRQGKLDEVLPSLKQAAEQNPNNGDIQLQYGRVLLRKKDYVTAIPVLEKAVKAAPGLAEAHALLGLSYVNTKRIEESVPEYKAAVAGDPKNEDYATTYGLLLGMTKQYDSGIQVLTGVTKRPDYKDPDAFVNLGYIYRNMEPRKAAEAVTAYKKALEYDPKNVPALLGLGWSAIYAHDYPLAATTFRKLADTEASLAGEAEMDIGWANLFNKDLAGARAQAEKAKAAGKDPAALLEQVANVEHGKAVAEEAAKRAADAANRAPVIEEKADVGTLSQILTTSRNPQEKIAAANKLGSMGTPAVAGLVRGVLDANPSVQLASLRAIGNIGPAARPVAERWLREAYQRTLCNNAFPTPAEQAECDKKKPVRDAITDTLLKIGAK